jgi:RNA polymerase sigma factor (sigma-70 family)
MQELLSRVQRTTKEMEASLRRRPTRAEVAGFMGIEPVKLEELYAYLQVRGRYRVGRRLARGPFSLWGGKGWPCWVCGCITGRRRKQDSIPPPTNQPNRPPNLNTNHPQSVRSLDTPFGGDSEGATLGDTIEDESALDADESSLMSGLKDDMVKLLGRLPAREAAVMKMRYGLDGEQYTLDDIGRLLKVTRERVRQIEAKALRALRSNMGNMEESIGEYSGASFESEKLAARTSSGTKKSS